MLDNLEEAILDGITEHINTTYKYHNLDIHLEHPPGTPQNAITIHGSLTGPLRIYLDLQNATLRISHTTSPIGYPVTVARHKNHYDLADPTLLTHLNNEINQWLYQQE
jgi:hypothetical protein